MPSPPFGYDKIDGELVPNYEDLELLEKVSEFIGKGFSLREASDYLSLKSSRKISHQGLKKRLQQGIYSKGGSLLGIEEA
jgi:hypothetical protein